MFLKIDFLLFAISLFADSDDDDTLITASVFNSPTESLQDLNSIPIAPYERFSYNSQHESFHTAMENADTQSGYNKSNATNSDDDDSDDTLVDGISIASSCNTYISEGGDAYKCAKDEIFFRDICKMGLNNSSELSKCISEKADEAYNNLCSTYLASDQRLHGR